MRRINQEKRVSEPKEKRVTTQISNMQLRVLIADPS